MFCLWIGLVNHRLGLGIKWSWSRNRNGRPHQWVLSLNQLVCCHLRQFWGCIKETVKYHLLLDVTAKNTLLVTVVSSEVGCGGRSWPEQSRRGVCRGGIYRMSGNGGLYPIFPARR